MPTTTSFSGLLALAALLASAAALPANTSPSPRLSRRNGCYSDGVHFSRLHGDETDTQEVVNDINTTCNMVANTVLAPGASWTHCSQWASSYYDDCYELCKDGCSGIGTSGGRNENTASMCLLGCDPNCGGTVTGTNHISWEVKNEQDVDATISWEACNAAFNTELGGCAAGSEQSHDGFWYKIDPNAGSCSA